MKSSIITALFAIFGASIAMPQTFGEITGSVTDSSSAVIAAATVTVTSLSTNQSRRVQTNDTGNYTVPFLVPGLYDIEASGQGFKSTTRKGVDLQVGQVARLNFKLEV